MQWAQDTEQKQRKKNTTQKNTKNETINPCTRDGYEVP